VGRVLFEDLVADVNSPEFLDEGLISGDPGKLAVQPEQDSERAVTPPSLNPLDGLGDQQCGI
jgi:hypothetical protein